MHLGLEAKVTGWWHMKTWRKHNKLAREDAQLASLGLAREAGNSDNVATLDASMKFCKFLIIQPRVPGNMAARIQPLVPSGESPGPRT